MAFRLLAPQHDHSNRHHNEREQRADVRQVRECADIPYARRNTYRQTATRC